MHNRNKAVGTIPRKYGWSSIYLSFLFYYIKLKSRLSVCPSVRLTVTPISQPCMHRLKPDLLEMKAESSGTAKYIFKSLHVRLLIHTSVLKALV